MNKPWICPEPCCCPVYQAKDSDYSDITISESGHSFLCLGRMRSFIEFSYNRVLHQNYLSTCMYTPLKGLIRFQENKADWQLLKTSYERALEKLKEIEDSERQKQA